jgi:hypothetical protein
MKDSALVFGFGAKNVFCERFKKYILATLPRNPNLTLKMIDSGLENGKDWNLHKSLAHRSQSRLQITAKGPKTGFLLHWGGLPLKTSTKTTFDPENNRFRSWKQNFSESTRKTGLTTSWWGSDQACRHGKGSKNGFYPSWGLGPKLQNSILPKKTKTNGGNASEWCSDHEHRFFFGVWRFKKITASLGLLQSGLFQPGQCQLGPGRLKQCQSSQVHRRSNQCLQARQNQPGLMAQR